MPVVDLDPLEHFEFVAAVHIAVAAEHSHFDFAFAGSYFELDGRGFAPELMVECTAETDSVCVTEN